MKTNQLKTQGVGVVNRRKLSGQALATFALMLPVLCGVLGLAVDTGHFYQHRRRMQTATDAAAMAGAQELRKRNYTQISPAALKDSALNGFDRSHGEVISVNRPPTNGSKAGNNDFVEVVMTQTGPTFFMRVLGIRSVTIQTRAVAGLLDRSPYCIYVLDPMMGGSFEINGLATVTSSCGVMVNSQSTSALREVGGGCMNGDHVDITGGYSGGCFTKTPNTNIPPEDDPLINLPEPIRPSGCDYTKYRISTGSATLNPGNYCGGLDINTDGVVTLNPGVYFLTGGGLTINSAATVRGKGVGFYNTWHPGLPYLYKPITINGSATVDLSASASGELAGILFMQDRSIVDTVQSNSITGNSMSTFQGTIYFPTQEVKYAGSSGIDGYTMIVANNLKITGTSDIRNYQPGQLVPPPPIKQSALVE